MIELLTKEQVRKWKSENPKHTTIKLPNELEGKRPCPLMMSWTPERMKRLIKEIEAEGQNRNEYARCLCNAALIRQGNNPIF